MDFLKVAVKGTSMIDSVAEDSLFSVYLFIYFHILLYIFSPFNLYFVSSSDCRTESAPHIFHVLFEPTKYLGNQI